MLYCTAQFLGSLGIPVEKGSYFLFVEGFALDKQKIRPQITANPKEPIFILAEWIRFMATAQTLAR
jgi:hypothetical protein